MQTVEIPLKLYYSFAVNIHGIIGLGGRQEKRQYAIALPVLFNAFLFSIILFILWLL